MSAIVSVYTDAVYDNLNPLHANWEPGREAKLGDYGLMRGHAFSCLGNIADLGIAFAVRNDGQKDQKFFASKNSVDIAFHAKGSVPVSGTVTGCSSSTVRPCTAPPRARMPRAGRAGCPRAAPI